MKIKVQPKFVDIGPDKKVVILSEEEYESILDVLDSIEAKRVLSDRNDPVLKWEDVHGQLVENRIAEVRKARGLTQIELARRLKINVALLRKHERKNSPPHPKQLAKIAAALGCTQDDLIG